ncbi:MULTISPECIES: ATP-binding protein [unclassified Streptomyces]|uniref:ATP-binding protein n=1 Tax=unclassified Streptomyces TaxID=2593676 RepID=UPI002DDBA657|nr:MULTISPECIES: ATP-binding protein [unclassified Streptomyces]WSA91721.1 ATP-binding protein [Streptomyces sp. NBC_01795]WSB76093.1 ATP-binding protein [Streptomyces sp. NBC_01775]WSS44475.1 ATP-binding protein [Streptomyces sp. NBC_01187]
MSGVRSTATEWPGLTVALLARASEVAGVRRQIVAHCRRWDVPDAVADLAALCVSELLTNVIVHVGDGAPATVRLTWCGGEGGSGEVDSDSARVRLAVTDADPRPLPAPRAAAPDAESGRGLALIEALSLRWGVERRAPYAKTVWCELGLSSE